MKDKSQLYEECKRRYKLKELTSRKAAELCQISQATFLQWIKPVSYTHLNEEIFTGKRNYGQ